MAFFGKPLRQITLFSASILALGSLYSSGVTTVKNKENSQENQVFQFMTHDSVDAPGENTPGKADSFVKVAAKKREATAYLWIPEQCNKVRGLLVMGQNIPEELLACHPSIRKVCSENDLGIVYCLPSYLVAETDPKWTVDALQRHLDHLAEVSGYDEVKHVPWIPLGESMHKIMVRKLLEGAPNRCIAGVFLNETETGYTNRLTPVLMSVGASHEWNQEKGDLREIWRDPSYFTPFFDLMKKSPDWPVSLLVDPMGGHFDAREQVVHILAEYIDAAAKARLPEQAGEPLKPVNLKSGFQAGIPIMGYQAVSPLPFSSTNEGTSPHLNWYFNKDLARDAIALASVDWNAKTQIPDFLDPQGNFVSMVKSGIPRPVPVETEEDGVTFTLKGALLPALPEGFVGAGEPLASTPGEPIVEWLSGPIVPLGHGKFRVSEDRTGANGGWVTIRKEAAAGVRGAMEPGGLGIPDNRHGKPQTISFDPIDDVPAGTKEKPLHAVSDSGMKVRFFVNAGPAVLHGDKLLFTPIPPLTRYPVSVTVTAWQRGRSTEPQIQEAKSVTQTFRITAP